MDVVRVRAIREDMEHAQARRLQPHFIASFFLAAFKRLGSKPYERESRRYEIARVPQVMRNRIPRSDMRASILPRYERVVFEKELVTVPGKPQAALICPGHPLLDALIDHLLSEHRDLLKQGAVLVNPHDAGETMRVLFYLEHTIQDASLDSAGRPRIISRQLQFVELDEQGNSHPAGYAPFLDYRPLEDAEQALVEPLRALPWLSHDLEEQARVYAITELVPRHFSPVKERRETHIDKTMAAVNERLTREISYWDYRSSQLRQQEAPDKTNAHLNSQQARQRAEELNARLERRMSELRRERQLSPLPPVVVGGVLVIPQGLLTRLADQHEPPAADTAPFAHETARIEQLAMDAVMQAERQNGYIPRDVSADKCGCDIESSIPGTGKLRFIEVKGRVWGAETVTVTRNEVLTALNKPDDFILAVVLVEENDATTTHYIHKPFTREPDFGATSINYDLAQLLQKSFAPA